MEIVSGFKNQLRVESNFVAFNQMMSLHHVSRKYHSLCFAVGAVANHFGTFEPCSTSIERKKSKESVTSKAKSGTRDFLFRL